jgi:trimeric autotransporter adhesin
LLIALIIYQQPGIMRNFLLLLVVVLGLSKTTFSQTDIVIGTGTTGNTGTGYPAPLQDWYEGSRAQYLFRASELISAGMSPGVITALKLNVVNMNTFSGEMQQFQVKIGGTSATTLSNTWEATTSVFGPVDYTPVLGINTITFSAPFFWNGSDNIVIEICNGLPGNETDGILHYTNNVTVPWTTGLSFNASHTYRLDNAGNLCSQPDIADNGLGSQTTRPNMTFFWTSAVACTGTPNGGTANSTITNILCPNAQFTLGVSGQTLASGLSYQWQSSTDNVSFSPIVGANTINYTTTQAAPVMYYRVVVTCTNAGGGSANSASVMVTNGSGPTYATLPYTESFENAWMNTCNTREIPNNSWRNTPGTGNPSWRRNDDGAAAAWTTPATGAYTPTSSTGTYSARFHSNNVPAGSTGTFDLHLNAATAATNKRLQFDFINTSGTDSISIHLSTNGGTSFVRLDSVQSSTAWRTKAVVFASTSATTILRFIAYSDDGTTDIGLDNVRATDFDDCSGTPVAGTATSNAPANICAGVPFTLSVTGQTDANLLTYQWEASTDGGATWNPIAGATSLTYVATQTTTTNYRLRITCTNGGAFANSATVAVTSPPIPAGVYTIDKNSLPATWFPNGTFFPSFNAAYTAMNCGIGSSVTFNVAPGTGPYNEQLIMLPIRNSNATNTVTFNGNGETITFATTAAERAVIKLRGAGFIRIENLVIVPTGTNAYGVQLVNDADSNIIRNNTINLSLTSTANTIAGIVMSGSETDAVGTGTTTALHAFNEIRSNTINGGFYGITLTATPAGGANINNTIYGNTIRNFHQYGIYIAGSGNTIIDSNQISRPNRTVTATTVEGIYFTTQSNNARISRNRITNPFGGLAVPATATFNGINFNSASASAGNDNIISNNLVGNITNTNGPISALVNTSSNSVSYFHNTVSLDEGTSTATGATRGLSVTGTADGIIFYNNMICITRGGSGQKHGIYAGSATPLLGSDYNNVYVNGTNGHFGFFGSNRTTLQAWQTATNHDASTHTQPCVFLSPSTGDFCSANAGIDNKGLYIGTDNDINNNIRSFTTPDIGAFECTPPACTIPIVTGATVVTPATICQGLPVLLNLNIGAYGSGQTFQWQFSPDNVVAYANLGDPKQTPDTIITANTTMWVRVMIKCATATEYSTPVLLTVNPAFPGGFYTINSIFPTNYFGPGTGFNFNSFNDAYTAMASCGILGPVVFDVVAGTGPYQERLKMDSIRGVDEVNTITYNGNGNIITFGAAPQHVPTSAERAVIKLTRLDHTTFNNLVIDASNGASWGYGVQLHNNADSNTFRNCTIITSTTSTSNTYCGVVINATDAGPISTGNTWCDGNRFEGNTITGGFYGVTLVGGTTAATAIANNKFFSNTVQEFYSTGFYIAGTNNTILDSNTITRPTRSSFVATTGIFSTIAANNGLIITRNRIRNLSGGNLGLNVPQYGIYHNIDQAATSPSIVTNNLVSDLGGIGVIYGLYNVGSDNVHYYHNTISLDSTNSTATGATRGYFQQSVATGLEFKNNIITIKRGGTGLKHAIYFDNTTSGIVSNYNDFYVSATNAHIGFWTANRTTLADWRTASTEDANSINEDPLYRDASLGDYRPTIYTVDNLGTTATSVPVPIDILGVGRTVTPDMGAFEFAAIACANPPTAGIASVSPNSNICLQDPIVLDITGHSPLGTLTFEWFNGPTATGPWTSISPVQYGPQFNTITTTSEWFRAAVTCNGTTVYTNAVQVVLNPIVFAGTHTINPGSPTSTPPWLPGSNFNSFQDAVTAMGCGISGPVVFNVATSTYNEQVRIGNIRNTSAVNTVTFQSASGNANDVNLTYASTMAAANYTLKLDSASYFRFRNMTITASDAVFGRAVEFAGRASFDSIVGCTIVAPVVATASNSAAGIYATALKGTNNVIKGNKISNGAAGIYWSGTNSATLSLNHLIDSNTISGAYWYGIFTNFQQNIKVQKNTINHSSNLAATSYGIYVADCDSTYDVLRNKINISNALTNVYGLYIINNDRSTIGGRALINGNIVNAVTGNSGSLWGLWLANNNVQTMYHYHYVSNNVFIIHTTGNVSYGIYNSNISNGKYYNNTINSTSPAATITNAAARFDNITATGLELRNNIFSHKGGGRALYLNNSNGNRMSNYNMYYSTGPVMIQRANPAGSYSNLSAWITASRLDNWSIVYEPAFVSNDDPRPNVASPEVWAMHGRGIQIPGNASDINGVFRPQTLTQGVPDLGAYEFFPTAQPTVLTAVPATPAANVKQVFMYGTDTVAQITWGATNFPPSITAQRYSGVEPGSRPYPYTDSMFFYTKLNVPDPSLKYDFIMDLHYIDPWQGSIPSQFVIGLGRRMDVDTAWMVGFQSVTNVTRKVINDTMTSAIAGKNPARLDRFTGFFNPYAPPVIPDKDSSNSGKRFWVAYPNNNQAGTGTATGDQKMVLYLSAEQAANVTVRVNGTSWIRNYSVPANTVTVTEELPKNPALSDNAQLQFAGLFDRGISIESNVPIVAYAHTIGNTSSGATMLLPVGVWGYDYKTLNITQSSWANAFSYFYVVADEDNTTVEITPSIAVQNTGMVAGQPYVVTLNQGEVFQVLAQSGTADISGSVVKSVPNSVGICHPIAVFSGSGRTNFTDPCSGGGDFVMQQNFPATAWGKRYLTAPTSQSTGAANLEENAIRIAVKDPTTQVYRNGTLMAGLINNHYYQYTSETADYITADKPIMVAQYMSGACAGVGDPEMMYISPIEQGIKKVGFYRNNEEAIQINYVTLIVPNGGTGLTSLVIKDGPTVQTPDHVYVHPNLPGYSVVIKRWTSIQRQVTVESDSAFTGITYGLGSVESYGYNVGTLVKNLRAIVGITPTSDPSQPTSNTICAGTEFTFTAFLPVIPTRIKWKLGGTANLTPSLDSTINNPVPSGTTLIDGTLHYIYKLTTTFQFTQPGLYSIQFEYEDPSIESCDKKGIDVIFFRVLPAPAPATIDLVFGGCEGDIATITAATSTEIGTPITQFAWTLPTGGTSAANVATVPFPTAGTYQASVETRTATGCVTTSTVTIPVNPRPLTAVVNDSIAVCPGSNATFTIQTPLAGATYSWYTTATGGTAITSGAGFTISPDGSSFTVNNVSASGTYYTDGLSSAGCTSIGGRVEVEVEMLTQLAQPILTVTGSTASTVTFSWNAIAGSTGYEVSVDNGVTWITPSSGATGLTHTVSGLGTLATATVQVRAIGSLSCQTNTSAPLSGCANSSAAVVTVVLQVCTGTGATFNIQNPVAGITYNWYDAATGGTLIGTGSAFTTPGISGTTNYFVEQVSTTGLNCVGSPRTQVTATILAPLATPVVTVAPADITATSVTFRWTAIAGATAYQVSIDNGATWITPSSGNTGLLHLVSGLTPSQQVCILVRAVGTIACQTSTSASVCERARPDVIFIPNTFTPNNDGKNDVLVAYGWAIQTIQFLVFNQWGEKIHEINSSTQDANGGFVVWDGKYQGKVQPVGVYAYVAKITQKDGTVVQKSGPLNIVR